MFFPLTSLLLLLSLLILPGQTSPARVIRQRLPKFKNFPIVGLKSNEPAELEDHRRDARETEQLEDHFVEEAVFLTPEDREQKALEDGLESLFEEEAGQEESYTRIERDGAHGHHHAGSQRGGRHNSQPAEPEYEEEDYDSYDYNDYNDYVEPAPPSRQQQRRGKQTGATGVALGVLSNPPSSEGNYNFK